MGANVIVHWAGLGVVVERRTKDLLSQNLLWSHIVVCFGLLLLLLLLNNMGSTDTILGHRGWRRFQPEGNAVWRLGFRRDHNGWVDVGANHLNALNAVQNTAGGGRRWRRHRRHEVVVALIPYSLHSRLRFRGLLLLWLRWRRLHKRGHEVTFGRPPIGNGHALGGVEHWHSCGRSRQNPGLRWVEFQTRLLGMWCGRVVALCNIVVVVVVIDMEHPIAVVVVIEVRGHLFVVIVWQAWNDSGIENGWAGKGWRRCGGVHMDMILLLLLLL